MSEKVILAYSGGLDTSVAIPWLKENYGYDVVALAVDLNGGEEISEALARAKKNGAVEAISVDASDEFVGEFIAGAIRANALYEEKYPLATALGRPCIVRHLVEEAAKRGAVAVAHGCTGKGNDQVRFDVGIKTLNPELKIIAPIREWKMSREEEIDYAKEKGLEITVDKNKVYSIDANLWGAAIEGGDLEDPWREPDDAVYLMTVPVSETPDESIYVEIGFEHGLPVKLNDKETSMKEIIGELNELAGAHGVGRLDMIENRLVGIKSREVYEAPAAVSIIAAHKALEDLTLERDTLHFKRAAEQKYADLIYAGMWFSPLREALGAFFLEIQKNVTGTVRLKFFKGNLTVSGLQSPVSLYEHGLATYNKSDAFDHDAATGFIELYGLPITEWAKKNKSSEGA